MLPFIGFMSFICSVCRRAAFICCFPLCIISVSCKFASVRVCFLSGVCVRAAVQLHIFICFIFLSESVRVCVRARARVCVFLWGWEVLDAYFVSTNYPATVPTNCQGLHASDVFKYPAAGGTARTKQVTGWALKLRTGTHTRAHMHTHTINSRIIGSSLPPATSAPYPHDVFVAGC